MRIRIARRRGGPPFDAKQPRIPTSKSHAQRALCLEAFLPEAPRVVDLPPGRDVEILRAALGSLTGGSREPVLNLRDNGTAMRVLSVLVPMLGRACRLDGVARLRERPMGAAVEFLARYGASCDVAWPVRVDGSGANWPGELVVDARTTTQVATGALLGAAVRVARGEAASHTVRVKAPAAAGYLGVTHRVLADFGFDVGMREDAADVLFTVRGFAPVEASEYVVPEDPSSYAFYAAFRSMGDGALLDSSQDEHPDGGVIRDLQRLRAAEPGDVVRIDDLGRRPDSFPCLVARAAFRDGRTELIGAPALRHKESDRVRAMAEVLRALRLRCEERPDGLVIEGALDPSALERVTVPTPDDHRIVMAAGWIGVFLPNGLSLDNPEAVAKSWPGYFDWLATVAEVIR